MESGLPQEEGHHDRTSGAPGQFESINQCARRAGVSPTAVRRWVQRGQIEYAQPGGSNSRVLIPVGALERLIQPPTAPEPHSAPRPTESPLAPAGAVPAWRRSNSFI